MSTDEVRLRRPGESLACAGTMLKFDPERVGTGLPLANKRQSVCAEIMLKQEAGAG